MLAFREWLERSNHTDVEVLRRRAAPMLVVLDLDYRIASAHPELDDFLQRYASGAGPCANGRLPPLLERAIREATQSWRTDGCCEATNALLFVAQLALRVVLMHGPRSACYAVTLERVAYREELLSIRDRFNLSEREVTVLAHLVRGLNAGEIAAKLTISQNTVREHVKHIYAKCGVVSRGELVARALNWSDTTP